MMQYPTGYPPTPTLIPPGTPIFDAVPDSYGLWATTGPSVQLWHSYSETGGLFVQGMLLIFLVITGMFVVIRFIRVFTRRDSNE